MKINNINAATSCAALLLASSLTVQAGSNISDCCPPSAAGVTSRPDAHAPIGVMRDHTHSQGKWMLSYRFMHMSMNGHQDNTTSLSSSEVYQRQSPSGEHYTSAADEMTMDMHMLGIMYAPTDKLTLMGMINYVEKNMKIVTSPHANSMGHGHMANHHGNHGHSSSGLGNVTLSALYNILNTPQQKIHLNLGLTLPTAEVEEKMNDTFLPYGMQLGTGVFGLNLGATYTAKYDHFSWGAQAMKSLALEDENDAGFRYGDTFQFTTWIAAPVTRSLSLSARLNYRYQGDISGHYNGPHNHNAPQHFQQNYGGHVLEIGLGANYVFQNEALRGHRVAIEILTPLIQDANGTGMDQDFSLIAGWQMAF